MNYDLKHFTAFSPIRADLLRNERKRPASWESAGKIIMEKNKNLATQT